MGQLTDAADAVDKALTLARALPFPHAEAKSLYVYGQLHMAKGEPDHARECFTQALAILSRLGERLYAGQIERALRDLVECGEEATERPLEVGGSLLRSGSGGAS